MLNGENRDKKKQEVIEMILFQNCVDREMHASDENSSNRLKEDFLFVFISLENLNFPRQLSDLSIKDIQCTHMCTNIPLSSNITCNLAKKIYGY